MAPVWAAVPHTCDCAASRNFKPSWFAAATVLQESATLTTSLLAAGSHHDRCQNPQDSVMQAASPCAALSVLQGITPRTTPLQAGMLRARNRLMMTLLPIINACDVNPCRAVTGAGERSLNDTNLDGNIAHW